MDKAAPVCTFLSATVWLTSTTLITSSLLQKVPDQSRLRVSWSFNFFARSFATVISRQETLRLALAEVVVVKGGRSGRKRKQTEKLFGRNRFERWDSVWHGLAGEISGFRWLLLCTLLNGIPSSFSILLHSFLLNVRDPCGRCVGYASSWAKRILVAMCVQKIPPRPPLPSLYHRSHFNT